MPFQTPILFVAFNRPQLGRKVFGRIRMVRPKQLFFAVDGPRKNHPDDRSKCEEVRSLKEQVDWDCKLSLNFADTNMGCRHRIASGITQALEQVEEVIILEDDCVPEIDFFRFCEEMLAYYRENPKVMAISGNDFLPSEWTAHLAASYYFLRTPLICGWATWRRAWQHYPHDLSVFGDYTNAKIYRRFFSGSTEYNLYKSKWKAIHSNQLDAWDYLWAFAVKRNGGLSICPKGNLISNIGFGPEATHTKSAPKAVFLETKHITFPLRHPLTIETELQRDLYIYWNFIHVSLWQRIKDYIAKLIFYRYWKKYWKKP